jgi:ferrous iron transport protein A
MEMINHGCTAAGASIKILKVGAQGVIMGFSNSNDTVVQKLRSMGLLPGMAITLEQRFPRFIVAAGFQRFALDESMIRAIYIRPFARRIP